MSDLLSDDKSLIVEVMRLSEEATKFHGAMSVMRVRCGLLCVRFRKQVDLTGYKARLEGMTQRQF